MTATPSRRTVLTAAAAGTAAAAASTVVAAPALASGPTTSRLLTTDKGLHLLRRTSYGPTASSAAWVKKYGTTAWIEQQLAPDDLDDTTCDDMLKHFPRINWSIPGVWAAENRTDDLQFDNFGWEIMQDLLCATIGRALWSRRQLYEVMVEFWSNHLNVTCPNGDVWDSRHLYDRRIRKYTFGRFYNLLKATTRQPAMLVYLNQAESDKSAPNENYARELLELHSVGVDGGYDEDDVQAAARLLTGLTLRNQLNDGSESWTRRTFYYDPSMHHTGAGQVLGFSWPAHSAANGLTYIDAYVTYLARHRKTAERIALKLGQRFVSDDPSAALVSHLADVYQQNDTYIVPVLRALLTSSEFTASAGEKVRRPYEDIIAGLRSIGVRPSTNPDFPADGPSYFDGLQAVYWQLRDLGHAPLNWGPPNGYPDQAKDWASANGVLGRWNNHRSHAYGWWPSASDKAFVWPAKPTVPGWKASDLPLCRALLPVTLPATYGGLVDVLCDRLLHQRMLPEHREAVAGYFGKTGTSALSANDAAVRWQFGDLVSLVLDSPYHALR